MTASDPIVIVGAARTPMGGFQGDFASLTAPALGAVAIKAAVERAGIAPERRSETLSVTEFDRLARLLLAETAA